MSGAAGHFTAVVVVEQVTPEQTVTNERGYDPKTVPRSVSEVAKIVVRAETLVDLQNKIAAHVALIA
jgi:hypothetical protein